MCNICTSTLTQSVTSIITEKPFIFINEKAKLQPVEVLQTLYVGKTLKN